MEYSSAHRLANDIRASQEYRTYHELKEEVMGDATNAALIREYRKLSVTLQMCAMSGRAADPTDMERFQGINSLLFAQPRVQQFLLAEMQLQQAMADIFRILTDAAGLEMELPDLGK